METNPDFNRSSSDSQGKRADSPNSKNSKSERKDRERERSPRRGRSPRRSRSRSLSPENENQGDTLYVSGLSSRTTEAELESRFSKFGKILECQLIKDPRTGESRGFCFIKMEAAEAADQALFNLDKAEIDERTITVEKDFVITAIFSIICSMYDIQHQNAYTVQPCVQTHSIFCCCSINHHTSSFNMITKCN
mmetsp:Transcript_14535/g.20256  ORF Transcript_14535/g.20256 Transcript_14535/m.20256 type:complete len:193 (+) Transcript_14535:22-600(+)